jgi:hypothetical protein
MFLALFMLEVVKANLNKKCQQLEVQGMEVCSIGLESDLDVAMQGYGPTQQAMSQSHWGLLVTRLA